MGLLDQYLGTVDDSGQGDAELPNDSQLLTDLLQNTTDRIYFKDTKSRFLRISLVLARLLGLTDPSEATGKTDRDFFAEEHAMNALQDELEIMRSGLPMIGKEEREDWPDGRVTWASTSKMPLFNASGKCIGTFGISRDISSHLRHQQELLESEARFRDLTSAIQETFWIFDVRSERTLYISPAYEQIWGRSRAQLYADGWDWLNTVHVEDRERVQKRFTDVGDRPFEDKFRLVRSDGEVRWVRGRAFPIVGEDGKVN